MGKKKQATHSEEFQVTNVDTSPSRKWWHLSPPLKHGLCRMCAVCSAFLPKRTV